MPALCVDRTAAPSAPPGAAISTDAPQLVYDARCPSCPTAATVMTPLHPAGEKPLASALLLPAATTTTVPRERAPLIAVCMLVSHVPLPPRLKLRTRAGLGLAGTPGTAPPEPQ